MHPKGTSTGGAGASSASSGVKIMKWVRTGETVQFPEEDDANDLLLQQQLQLQEQQLQQQQQEQSQLEMQQEADQPLSADTQEGQIAADASDKLEGTNATGASDAMEVDQRPGVEEMELARGADLHAEQAAADLLEQAQENVQEELNQGEEGKTAEQDTAAAAAAIPEPGPDNDIAALAKEQGSIATDDVEERLQAPVEAEETGEKSQELQLNEEEGDASKSVPSAMQIQVDQQPLQ